MKTLFNEGGSGASGRPKTPEEIIAQIRSLQEVVREVPKLTPTQILEHSKSVGFQSALEDADALDVSMKQEVADLIKELKEIMKKLLTDRERALENGNDVKSIDAKLNEIQKLLNTID